jgi:hypothetical protein
MKIFVKLINSNRSYTGEKVQVDSGRKISEDGSSIPDRMFPVISFSFKKETIENHRKNPETTGPEYCFHFPLNSREFR